MSNRKNIMVLAGPSGVGKSTLAKFLVDNYKQFLFSVSSTTRKMRDNDVDGVNYYFLSGKEFKKNIDIGNFIEYEEVYPGVFYGTLKSEINKIIKSGKYTVLDIDVLGALNIKKIYGDSVYMVFVKAESVDSLKDRLKKRNSETKDQLETRIDRFKKELELEKLFDETIINETGKLDYSKEQISNIVNSHFI